MRGPDTFTEGLFTMRRLDDFVPADHPMRRIRVMVNEALAKTTTPANPPGRVKNPPKWRKFVNFASSIADNVTGSPTVAWSGRSTSMTPGGAFSVMRR